MPFFKKLLFFRTALCSQQSCVDGTKSSHILSAPINAWAPPPPTFPPEGTLVRVDEPTPTHRCHPESKFMLGFTLGVVQSMGLQMYNEMYLPLQYQREQFHWPKNLLYSAYRSFLAS